MEKFNPKRIREEADAAFEYGVTSSYDEVRRFKSSAAAAKRNKRSEVNLDSTVGLQRGYLIILMRT